MFRQRDRFHDWITEECKRQKGKPWLLTAIGRPPSIVVSTVDAFEDVLSKQFKTFEKGPLGRAISQDFFGQGIFSSDGVNWIHQRKTASHLFSLQMTRDIMEGVVLEETANVCNILDAACESHEQVEFKDLMDYFSTDVFVRIGFGVDLGCLKNEQEPEFFRAFSRCSAVIGHRIHQPMWLWQLKRFLDVGIEKQFKKDIKLVNDKIYEVIDKSMTINAAAKKNRGDGATMPPTKDLISLFLDKECNEYKDGDETVRVETTPQLIRDIALNFIGAGRGTTAYSFSWFIVMMNRYPDAMKKVRAELQTVLPELCQGTKKIPTVEDVKKLVYLEAALKESLRLNPPGPANARTANQDTTLSDGTFIKAGTRVLLPTYALSRMSWAWGDDACEYKPERWIDPATGKLFVVSPYKFMIFHAGPRLCLGIKLAMMELKIVLATMLSRYELKITQNPFEISYATSIVLPIKGHLYVNVAHANNAKTSASPGPVDSAVSAGGA
uniref:Cytochrome P450 n=1 Tax=Globisporangium ultimum (strain ATCC 200006 / CBS 805.95 / DAOM BR144) TaxID=431595 RepID=K3W7E7_GLOUD